MFLCIKLLATLGCSSFPMDFSKFWKNSFFPWVFLSFDWITSVNTPVRSKATELVSLKSGAGTESRPVFLQSRVLSGPALLLPD